MKYDARACKFNMDTGCVELLLQDGRKISIDCTGVEDALDAVSYTHLDLRVSDNNNKKERCAASLLFVIICFQLSARWVHPAAE